MNGTTTTLSTATLDVEDKNITLNKGSGDTSASADGAGITIQDAVDASNDASLTWNAANDQFVFSHKLVAPRFIQSAGAENTFYSAAFSRSGSGTAADVYGTNGTLALGTDASNTKLVLVSGGVTVTGNTQATSFSAGTANPNAELLYLLGSGHTGHGASNTGSLVSIVESTSGNLAGLWFGSMTNENTGVIGSRTASGNIAFQTYSGGWAERMRINSSGNVGINSTSPQTKFVVQHTDGQSGIEFSMGASLNYIQSYNRNTSDYVALKLDGEELRFGTNNGTERMRIDSNGQVMIGHTSSFAHSDADNLAIGNGSSNSGLTIYTGSDKESSIIFGNAGTNGNIEAGIKYYHESHGTVANRRAMTFATGGSMQERMRINSSGNVGIGATSPGAPLDIETGGNTQDGTFYSTITINNTGSSTFSGLRYDRGGVARFRVGLRNDDKFQIANLFKNGSVSADDSALVMQNNGAVGIGVASPGAKLTIQSDGGGAEKTFETTDASGNQTFWINGGGSAGVRYYPFYVGKQDSSTANNYVRSGEYIQSSGPIASGTHGRYIHNFWGPRMSGGGSTYYHLRTKMWGGGSPHGNTEYIMGGFIIKGYRYAGNANHYAFHQFHNWSGALHNYTVDEHGSWTGASHVYIDSTGFLTIRLSQGSYKMFTIDYVQYNQYNKVDAGITNETSSNSATI